MVVSPVSETGDLGSNPSPAARKRKGVFIVLK